MKVKHPINLHKSASFLFILGLMAYYQNFTLASWVYLALHGTYGIMWLIKDRLYPDRQWEQEVSLGFVASIFIPNMLKKDKSLARYEEFKAYKARTGLLLPKLFVAKTQQPSAIAN